MDLSAARVLVSDIVAARQFYERKLGLRLKSDGCEFGYCVFKSGSTGLVVESVAADAPADDRALIGCFTGLSFTVEDAVAKRCELLALGVPFSGPPGKQFWGGTLATLVDPSGNELQIVQLPQPA